MPEKPGKQPADRKSPAQVDAEGGPVSIEFKDVVFEFPRADDDLDGDVVDALESDRPSATLRALLGDKQWTTFKALKPTLGDYRTVLRSWVKDAGLGDSAGE